MGKVFEVVERSSGFWVVDGKGQAFGPYTEKVAYRKCVKLEAGTHTGRLAAALRACVMATDTYVAFVATGTPVTAAALSDLAKAQTEARNLLSEVS